MSRQLSKALRRVERVIQRVLTVDHRRPFFCDSHVRACYFCILFRQRLHHYSQPFFYINTRSALYYFERQDTPRLTMIVKRGEYTLKLKGTKWVRV